MGLDTQQTHFFSSASRLLVLQVVPDILDAKQFGTNRRMKHLFGTNGSIFTSKIVLINFEQDREPAFYF